MKKALIALDLDGTLTDTTHEIPPEVIDYLKSCHEEGYVIAFITGRFFPFAYAYLKDLSFPYYLAAQNGAQIFEMPSRKNIANYYLSKDLIMMIDQMTTNYAEDFIVYSDERLDYQTFYRKGRFSSDMLKHVFQLEKKCHHKFVELKDYADIPAKYFLGLKHFGTYEQIFPLHQEISLKLPVHQSLIQDPSSDLYSINIVTHHEASKGGAVASVLKAINMVLPVIAAGNDRNDISLLMRATVGICVGEGAPQELKDLAKWIAPSPGLGLIPFLDKAKVSLGG